jgi:hypothetical protein
MRCARNQQTNYDRKISAGPAQQGKNDCLPGELTFADFV